MKIITAIISFVVLFSVGCVNMEISKELVPPRLNSAPNSVAAEDNSVDEILADISEKNAAENNIEQIASSYNAIHLKKLRDIPPSEYGDYARYLDNGAVYIIVHPAFYVFFQDDQGDQQYSLSKKNAVERFLEKPTSSAKIQLLKNQEKALRDFFEFKSISEKLIIVVLPGNYKNYRRYVFRNGPDEFARYINEVTNGSDSVLYLYSRKANDGRLLKKDLRLLLKFLDAIDPKEIMLGGGYFERCLESFYKRLSRASDKNIYVVTDLTQLAPVDMGLFLAYRLLNKDGSVDREAFSQYIEKKLEDNYVKYLSGTRNLW